MTRPGLSNLLYAPLKIMPGQPVRYTAVLEVNRIVFTPRVRWSLSNGRAGSMNRHGRFTAAKRAAGTFSVHATDGRHSASSMAWLGRLGTPAAGSKIRFISFSHGRIIRTQVGRAMTLYAAAKLANGVGTSNFNCRWAIRGVPGLRTSTAPCSVIFTPRRTGTFFGSVRAEHKGRTFKIFVGPRPTTRAPAANATQRNTAARRKAEAMRRAAQQRRR